MKKTGFTLIETVIGILIGSILILALSKFLSSGLKSFQKGSSHLTNIQAAALLMAQIEQDLSMATRIIPTDGNDKLQVEIAEISESAGKLTASSIYYQPEPQNMGYQRTVTSLDGTNSQLRHVFCKDVNVTIEFEPKSIPGPTVRTGLTITITTTSASGGEKNTFQQFIFCLNLLENHNFLTSDWLY